MKYEIHVYRHNGLFNQLVGCVTVSGKKKRDKFIKRQDELGLECFVSKINCQNKE